MRNTAVLLTLFALGTSAFAQQAPRNNVAPGSTQQRSVKPQTPSAPSRNTPQNQTRPSQTAPQSQAQRQAETVRYYAGDPLAGGRFLQEVQVTPQPGAHLFANAPQGATFAVVNARGGRLIVNLQEAANADGTPGGRDLNARPDGQRDGNGGRNDRDGGPQRNGPRR